MGADRKCVLTTSIELRVQISWFLHENNRHILYKNATRELQRFCKRQDKLVSLSWELDRLQYNCKQWRTYQPKASKSFWKGRDSVLIDPWTPGAGGYHHFLFKLFLMVVSYLSLWASFEFPSPLFLRQINRSVLKEIQVHQALGQCLLCFVHLIVVTSTCNCVMVLLVTNEASSKDGSMNLLSSDYYLIRDMFLADYYLIRAKMEV